MKEKILSFIKNRPVASALIGGAAVALVVSLIVTAIMVAVMNDGGDEQYNSSGDESIRTAKWGSGLTEGIPQFSGECQDSRSDGSFAAFYYTNITGEQAESYISLLQEQCSVTFSGSELYPRTAIYGDRIIAIHYNVTEMTMSVTVTKNANIDQSGE